MKRPDPTSAARPLRLGFATLAVLVAGFGGWASMTAIAGAVIAPGRIEVEANRLAIEHPEGGVVAMLAVREGDRVATGDLLLRLDPVAVEVELDIVVAELAAITARRARLEAERDGRAEIAFGAVPISPAGVGPRAAAEIDGQRRLHAAQAEASEQALDALARRRLQIVARIEGLRAEAAARRAELALVSGERADQTALRDRGLAEARLVRALARDEARLQGALAALAAAEAEAREAAAEVGIEMERIGSATRIEALTALREVAPREAELEGRRRLLQHRLAQLEIRAPADGAVIGLAVAGAGAVIRAGEPIMALVPADRPLVVAARVDPRDIAAVFPGQVAGLRSPALDQAMQAAMTGRVTRISADTFSDERSGAPYYRIEIAVPPTAPWPGAAPLLPGMPVEVHLATPPRSPLSLLVRPLAVYFDRALRSG